MQCFKSQFSLLAAIAAGLMVCPHGALSGAQSHRLAERVPTRAAALSPQQIFRRVAPSVMVVESLDAKGAVVAIGSGVVIARDRVVTNRHVIEDGIRFRLEHDGKTWPAELVRVDPDHDLAELFVTGLTAPDVRVRASSTLRVGEKVYAIGAPEGLELTISGGLISGLRDFDKERVIQTSAAISPGSSGGGLFDSEGRLVGITTFYLKEGQSLNFALPAELAADLNRQPLGAASSPARNSTAFEAVVWFELGSKAYDAGEYDAAVRDYKEAIRLNPDHETAWFNLGCAYLGLSWSNFGDRDRGLVQKEKAASALEEAVRLKPDDASAWHYLGMARMGLGPPEGAIAAFKESVRLKPSDEVAWFNLGILQGELRNYEEAARAEGHAVELKPDDQVAWTALAILYKKLGQFQKAALASQEASRLMGTANQSVPSSPPPDVGQDLPADELAKLGGHAEFTGWFGRDLDVNLYNGSSWVVSSVTIRLEVPDQGISRLYRMTSEYSTAALSDGVYEEYVDFTVTAGEKWGWQIVSARGFPPK